MKAAYAGEQKQELQVELMTTFQAADTDQKGVLNEPQFVDFCTKAQANHTARGWTSMTISADTFQKAYGLINQLTEGVDGVSLMDIANQTQKKADIMKELVGEEI